MSSTNRNQRGTGIESDTHIQLNLRDIQPTDFDWNCRGMPHNHQGNDSQAVGSPVSLASPIGLARQEYP